MMMSAERKPDERTADSQSTDTGAMQAAIGHLAAASAPESGVSPVIFIGLVRLAEAFALCCLGMALHALYVVPAVGFSWAYPVATAAMTAASILMFQSLRLYRIGAFLSPVWHGWRLAGALSLAFLLALALIFLLKQGDTFSRVWFISWFAGSLVLLAVMRMAVFALASRMTRRGQLDRRAVIVGGGNDGERLLLEPGLRGDGDLHILGVFDDRNEDRIPDLVAGYPKLGTVDDLVAFARRTRIDVIIVALPVSAETRVLTMLRKLWVLPVDIRLAAHTNKLRLRPRSYSLIGNVPVLDVFDKPISDWDAVMKSAFDRIVGSLALIALSPLMILTALAIKLDSRGPVLFRQKRYGFNNELIEIYKFRSMYTDHEDAGAKKLVTRADPRVTRIGRLIRKASIDELPQLFNVVLHGNLSLIGPRPHALHAKAADRQYDEVVEGYFARHKVRPGMTGWAQVNGWRGETDTPEKLQRRVEHDLYYIENWSLLFDLYILAITPFALLKTDNAY
jgi:Undecaprenyl-phosphate glucose phosphotransferase